MAYTFVHQDHGHLIPDEPYEIVGEWLIYEDTPEGAEGCPTGGERELQGLLNSALPAGKVQPKPWPTRVATTNDELATLMALVEKYPDASAQKLSDINSAKALEPIKGK